MGAVTVMVVVTAAAVTAAAEIPGAAGVRLSPQVPPIQG